MADEATAPTKEAPKLNPSLCSFCGKGDYPYRVQSTEHPNVSICFPCCHEVLGMILVTAADLSAEKTKRESAEKEVASKKEVLSPTKEEPKT